MAARTASSSLADEPSAGGGPWSLTDGREPDADDELVMDATSARRHGLALGDRVRVLDRDLRLVGLSRETTFWAGSLAFTRMGTLQSLLRAEDQRSFLLVQPAPGRADEVAQAITAVGVTATPVETVIGNDQRLLARIYDAPVGLMVMIAFVVGVLVVGLIVYTATVERRREYGVLKAIGARNRMLAGVVATQALIATTLGTIGGVMLAWLGSAALMAWRPQFVVRLEPEAAAIVVLSSFVMALLAALGPARSLGRLDPASVLRA